MPAMVQQQLWPHADHDTAQTKISRQSWYSVNYDNHETAETMTSFQSWYNIYDLMQIMTQ